MKQLVILSGKGGTGKTSISASLAWLSSREKTPLEPVFVDADVDAANLSLILQPQESAQTEFWGGSLAEIDEDKCNGCEACIPVCRYDAIFPSANNAGKMWIDPIACDGCAACVYACPQQAIAMKKQQEGYWYTSKTPGGMLFHAELFPGRDNSGKLVTMVKQQAKLFAEDNRKSLVIIDGPPGIGCPVISACAGTDLGLVVAEPGQAGLHDMKRILRTLDHFKVPAKICINKSDLYPEGSAQIRDYAKTNRYDLVGEVPFDENIPKSMLMGKSVIELFPDSPASNAIKSIWENLIMSLT